MAEGDNLLPANLPGENTGGRQPRVEGESPDGKPSSFSTESSLDPRDRNDHRDLYARNGSVDPANVGPILRIPATSVEVTADADGKLVASTSFIGSVGRCRYVRRYGPLPSVGAETTLRRPTAKGRSGPAERTSWSASMTAERSIVTGDQLDRG